MTKKSKKRRLSKRGQKLNLSEVNDGTTKVTIFKEKPKEEQDGTIKEEKEKSSSVPFLFEEPEWFKKIIFTLSEHLGIIPQRVVY